MTDPKLSTSSPTPSNPVYYKRVKGTPTNEKTASQVVLAEK